MSNTHTQVRPQEDSPEWVYPEWVDKLNDITYSGAYDYED